MAKPVTTMEGTMLLGGIDFGCRGTFFLFGVVLVVFLDDLVVIFHMSATSTPCLMP